MSAQEGAADQWVGYKTFDLSEARTKELVRMPSTTAIVPLRVDSAASFRFGQRNAPAIDLRDLDVINFEHPVGEVYMDNPAGSAGDVAELLLGRGGELDADRAGDTVAVNAWNADPLPETPNAGGLSTDSLTGDGSFGSQAIPDGFALFVKAETSNGDTAFVDGYPIAAGEETPPLHVDNFDVPAVTFGTQTDTVHAIAEAP